MKSFIVRKLLYYGGNVLTGIGAAIMLAGAVGLGLGPEVLAGLYEIRLVHFVLLVMLILVAGGALLGLGVYMAAHGRKSSAANSVTGLGQGTAPQRTIRCGKCEALNEQHAKFCNQCGAVV